MAVDSRLLAALLAMGSVSYDLSAPPAAKQKAIRELGKRLQDRFALIQAGKKPANLRTTPRPFPQLGFSRPRFDAP